MNCKNCGKTKCNCAKSQNEIDELSSKFAPMSKEEKRRKINETVKKMVERYGNEYEILEREDE